MFTLYKVVVKARFRVMNDFLLEVGFGFGKELRLTLQCVITDIVHIAGMYYLVWLIELNRPTLKRMLLIFNTPKSL